MRLVAANSNVANALRNALSVHRETTNGEMGPVFSPSDIRSSTYHGPFQGEVLLENMHYYLRLSDGLRNDSTTAPGRIYTANGHFLLNAPACKIRIPSMEDSESRILAVELEYASSTGSSVILHVRYFLYSEEDPFSSHTDEPYRCYYNILGIRSGRGVPYVVQQFLTGDLWTLDRLGIWYKNGEIW